MKVRVSHLPLEGLVVKAELSLEKLNTRMNEGSGSDIVFVAPPAVDLTVFKTPQGAETKGRISTRYTQPCGRCDIVVERTLEADAGWVLHRKPEPVASKSHARGEKSQEKRPSKKTPSAAPDSPLAADFEDDVGISFFDGDQVDLEELLQELLILQLERFWSPPCDSHCKCLQCGTVCKPTGDTTVALDAPTLEKVSLGALLKKAGVSNN